MARNFSDRLLHNILGWKEDVTVALPQKCVIALAPHTSNWDFVLGQLYARAHGWRINFLMKREWFFWPLGPLFRRMGGIPVTRSRHTSLTDNLARQASEMETFRLCITPEGTRSPNPDWKLGFYYIALKANIPVLLYGVDYSKKLIKCTKSFTPTGNAEEDMRRVKNYFKDFKGKHPENFKL